MSLREQKHLLKPQRAGWPSSAMGEPGQPCDQLKGPQKGRINHLGAEGQEGWAVTPGQTFTSNGVSTVWEVCLLKLSYWLAPQVTFPSHPQRTPDPQHGKLVFSPFLRTKVCSASSLFRDSRNLKEIDNMFDSQHLCLKGFLFHINTSMDPELDQLFATQFDINKTAALTICWCQKGTS